MTNIVPFDFESKQVRVIVINDEPWFVATDVAKILEHSKQCGNDVENVG